MESRCCTISTDEISLKTSLLYDSTTDKAVGVEDFGNRHRNKTQDPATIATTSFLYESCPSDIMKQKL